MRPAMSSRRNSIRLVVVVVSLAGLIGTSHLARLRAQSDPWVAPFPMILTSQRAAALMEAAERRLDFVPWEVLVKFKEGNEETSRFAGAGDNVSQMNRGYTILGGAEVRTVRWIVVGAEAQYRDVPHPIGRECVAGLRGKQPRRLRDPRPGRSAPLRPF
jgi:hypothetical protein